MVSSDAHRNRPYLWASFSVQLVTVYVISQNIWNTKWYMYTNILSASGQKHKMIHLHIKLAISSLLIFVSLFQIWTVIKWVWHTLSQQISVEKLGVFRSCKMWINLAQYTASEAVKQQRGNTHSWRNWVMVSFFVDPVKQINIYPVNTMIKYRLCQNNHKR